MRFPHGEIEKKIGYVFRDKALLEEAFTHSTYANVHGGKDNERMEYLGDAVLQLVVTEWQYLRYAKADEGAMTRGRQQLVCEDALLDAVKELDIEQYLLLAGSKANVGKKTISSLFESILKFAPLVSRNVLNSYFSVMSSGCSKGLNRLRPRI